MITEAIILAGGLGTRLRPAVPDLPKCMAPVAGHPFLHYLIDYFHTQGIRRFIFSLGYKHKVIEEFLAGEFAGLPAEYVCVVEEEPLGTGGAVLLSAAHALSPNVLVLNGDTFFEVDARVLADLHERKNADCTLSLKPMNNMERYGVVDLDEEKRIISFREKNFYPKGLINGGVYALKIASLPAAPLSGKFSLEKDYLEKLFDDRPFYGCVQDGYFIDIGIPDDFNKADADFRQKNQNS